jgi:tetratricopeptide (TPR) repeat protein
LYSVAPTAAFWDCGELIATSYIMGVPHPPGTPLFVAIGRLFTLLPLSPEIAFRVNFVPVLFGAISCGLIYLIVVKLISYYGSADRFRWLAHVSGIVAGLLCGFAYSYWDNCVEAEVYGPCVVVALSVLYMALLWRDRVESGKGDNRLILASIFLLFLATGIHFTPMMVVFAVLVFALVVDRESVLRLRLFEFVTGFLVILAVNEMGGGAGGVVLKLLVAGLMVGSTWLAIRVMEGSRRTATALYGLGLFFLMMGIGYVATGGRMMDNMVLFLASPTVAMIEMWVQSPVLVILFVAAYGAYLYWLWRQGRLNWKYVGLMLGLIFLAGSVQFIMLVRAGQMPSINEVDPSKWRDFVSVLRREQYDPMKLLPRKTQFLLEEDWRMNQNPRFGVLVAYFEQIKFYLRYFLWQWGNERFFDIFLGVKWQALLGLVPPALGLWGIWHQFRREKRSFVLIFVAFLVASLGLITYLNLKYSPSDPRPELRYREVRERDYFYAFSFVFYTIFIGVGAYAFLRMVVESVKWRKLPSYLVSGALVGFSFVPMVLNYGSVTRRHNWIPAEYGYNMLISCPGEKAVIFTNGDNDTFPLWFMQTVPSVVAGQDSMFGKNVAVANLSLLNTAWYCKQLKRWGAPISFTEAEIEKLPQGFVGEGNRTYLLKDVMIRDIVATAGGVKLAWPDDYAMLPEKYIAKVFEPGYRARSAVYFATTVSRDNLVDVEPYLRLEGLVNRVVPERGANQVDVAETRRLLYEVYKMKSMLDPQVNKDDNTKGLLINYAASYLALASEYQRTNQPSLAQEVLERALAFDIDPERKLPLYYHHSIFAMLSGDYDAALASLDSLSKHGLKDPEITMRRGLAYQAKGDLPRAEQYLQQALAEDPSRSEAVQALYQLYRDEFNDTARANALLEQWQQRSGTGQPGAGAIPPDQQPGR